MSEPKDDHASTAKDGKKGGDGTKAAHTGYFDNEDLNGDCYVAGETGEAEAILAHRIIGFPDGCPCATQPFERVTFDTAKLEEFINLNFALSKSVDNPPSDADSAKIAYIRYLAVREGLASHKFDTKAYNVRYNESIDSAVHWTESPWGQTHPLDADTAGLHQDVKKVLTKDVMKKLRADFANMVCAVAYMFRVRGHHWLPDMDDKYKDLWKKCQRDADQPGLKWELIAHNATHAIMPAILDIYWEKQVQSSNIAGALVKRFDSAPAGVAGVKALDAGMTDIAINVPGIKVHFRELYEEKDRLVKKLKAERWAGSINRRFYGAGDLGFDEGRFASIAATILAALNQLAPTSPLRQSAALKRMAQAAPMTGALMVKMIVTAAEDPENARALVVAPSPT